MTKNQSQNRGKSLPRPESDRVGTGFGIGSKIYEAVRLGETAAAPGRSLSQSAWDVANLETGFAFPWENRPAPRTEFRALFDEQALHFAFRIWDDDVVLAEKYGGKEDVVREDRAELFFAALDDELATYFCLEIDPLGRVLDYRASFYRKFDFSWTFPGLKVAGCLTDDGYRTEGLIPWTSLESLGFPSPGSGQPIKIGLYRAEFRRVEGARWMESWISWIDPQTPEPDFHVPQSFGYLKLAR